MIFNRIGFFTWLEFISVLISLSFFNKIVRWLCRSFLKCSIRFFVLEWNDNSQVCNDNQQYCITSQIRLINRRFNVRILLWILKMVWKIYRLPWRCLYLYLVFIPVLEYYFLPSFSVRPGFVGFNTLVCHDILTFYLIAITVYLPPG